MLKDPKSNNLGYYPRETKFILPFILLPFSLTPNPSTFLPLSISVFFLLPLSPLLSASLSPPPPHSLAVWPCCTDSSDLVTYVVPTTQVAAMRI